MRSGPPTVRLFLLAVAAALPPLILAVILLLEPPSWLSRFSPAAGLVLFALLTGAWWGVVAIVGARGLGDDLKAMVELAQRGRTEGNIGPGPAGAVDRLGAMLDERNRQIAELAERLRASPIQGGAKQVALATVQTAVSVTHDATWTLAVSRSPSDSALPRGIYGTDGAGAGSDNPAPLSEVAGWAATVEPDDASIPAVRYAEGPWGAFVAVEVAAGEDLRASLLAPWEGRSPPSPAERELLSLLGQNAAIAIEHALLVEQLQAQTDELNRMASVQSDFLRGVTHDLQTPLTRVSALASEVREQPHLSDAARADLETISHQADRLRRMVAQLLVASRLEVGALQPAQEVFRVEPLVHRTWDALRAQRPFRLEVTGVPHLAVADPDRLEQVLWALLDNAVKYSPAGSPISVTISGESNGSDLQSLIQIRDEGSGMDPESQRRAFEQFYRSDTARRLAPDGSGVGLYAARGLMRAMGGDIELRSTLGGGTTATVTLPSEAVDDGSVAVGSRGAATHPERAQLELDETPD
jgi:signal transduction histidine kinase